MSLDREYETSKIGPTKTFDFGTSTPIRIRLVNDRAKHSFRIRVTEDVRIQQGGRSTTVTKTGEDKGMLLSTSYIWRCDVDGPDEAYLSVVGDTAAGDIEITALTYVTTDDPVAEV